MRIDNDDTGIGTKQLKVENTKTRGTRPVQRSEAAALEPGSEARRAQSLGPVKPPVDRRKGDRRQHTERREQQQPVLLDTRTHRERRRQQRRQQDRAPGAGKPPGGIDEQV
jgi:hypothetical protein